ncbi:MAG: hypothetical protein OEY63_06905, partial [Gemmatimonadota bacterium]|nr:hypothetical protein [Gemmatimonadota bacterium]
RIEGIAHKTGDIIERTKMYDTLDEALADCTLVAGLTARGRAAKRTVAYVEDAMPEIVEVEAPERAVLLFGPEDRGLTNEDLDRCHRLVTIPTSADHSSMNLAQAATVTFYELFRAQGRFSGHKKPRRKAPPATREELEMLFGDVENGLAAIEFFKTRTQDSIMRTVRELVHRSPVDQREVKLVRAMALEVVRFLERKGVIG